MPARPSSADRRPPSPEDLRDAARFGLVAELPHDAVVPALQAYLRAPSPVMAAYWGLNVVVLGVLAAVWRRSGLPPFDAFSTACLGMTLGYLALVPVHEAVHAAAYRAAGARRVAVTYAWRRLTALCVADRAVLGAHAFAGVCLAPLAALTPPLAAAAALLAGPGRAGLLAAGTLLLHTGACSGDAALVALLWRHRGAPLFTYDDVAAGRSYVYRARTT